MEKTNSRYFLVHEKLLKWEHFKEPNVLQVFIFLLLSAIFSDTLINGIMIKRGQCLTSVKRICTYTGLSTQNVRTILNKLSASGEIIVNSQTKFTIVTIVNYNLYQLPEKNFNNKNQQHLISVYSNKIIPIIKHTIKMLLETIVKIETAFNLLSDDAPLSTLSKNDDLICSSTPTCISEEKKSKTLTKEEKEQKIASLSDWKISNPDLAYDKNVHKLFDIYEQQANSLIPLRFEKRNLKIFQTAKEFLIEIGYDFDYFSELIQKANEQKTILDNKIDFQALLKNHSRIYSEVYRRTKTKPTDYTNIIKEVLGEK